MLDRPTEDKELMARFPAYCMPNVWPEGDDCPDLEPAFKALGRLIVSVGELVGAQIDSFATRAAPGYPPKYLQEVIRTSLDCKVRSFASDVASAAHRWMLTVPVPIRCTDVTRHACCTTSRARTPPPARPSQTAGAAGISTTAR